MLYKPNKKLKNNNKTKQSNWIYLEHISNAFKGPVSVISYILISVLALIRKINQSID